MLLSKLVYLSIKNVLYQNDGSFVEENFLNGSFDNDIDLSMQIHNVFSPLNEAIARLSDLNRIPYRFERIKPSIYGEIELSNFVHPVKEVMGVSQGGHATAFKKLGSTLYLEWFNSDEEAVVEYSEDIKTFSYEDLEENEDMKNYGISDAMCNYIIEFVKGKLLEPIAPELANLHITTAESYFQAINPVKKATIQSVVHKKFEIGM